MDPLLFAKHKCNFKYLSCKKAFFFYFKGPFFQQPSDLTPQSDNCVGKSQ